MSAAAASDGGGRHSADVGPAQLIILENGRPEAARQRTRGSGTATTGASRDQRPAAAKRSTGAHSNTEDGDDTARPHSERAAGPGGRGRGGTGGGGGGEGGGTGGGAR